MIKRIYLEITNACNLDCPFCTNNKGKEFISLDNFKKTIEQIKEITPYIYLHVLGEPMLHPFFNDFLDILDKNNMKVQLVTNGTLLNKYDLDDHSSIRKVSISLHSYLGKDKKYYSNINTLLKKKHDYILDLRFYNQETLSDNTKKYLEELKENYPFKTSKVLNQYEIKKNVYVTTNSFFKWPNINDDYHSDFGTCLGGKSMLAILVNGDVTMCCLDTMGINKLGNIYENSLIEIINSNLYKKVISDLNNNKLTMPLCQKCTYHDRFDANK